MDILRVLSTPDLEVRKKTLQLALDLVSSRNVEEVNTYFLCVCFHSSLFFSEAYDSVETYLICFIAGDCFEERSD